MKDNDASSFWKKGGMMMLRQEKKNLALTRYISIQEEESWQQEIHRGKTSPM